MVTITQHAWMALASTCLLLPCAVGDYIIVNQDGTGDYITIADAVAAAVSGADEVLVYGGVYEETIDLNGKEIVIRGIDIDQDVVIDGLGLNRCVLCDSGETSASQFVSLVFQNGYDAMGGGGTYIESASPVFEQCSWLDCDAHWGGALRIYGVSAAPYFDHCIISNSTATQHGGGVSIANAAGIVFEDCEITGNSASSSGGGGMAILNGTIVSMIDCEVSWNTNGGIDCILLGELSLDDCDIVSNTGQGQGAGIRLYDTSGTFTDTVVRSNTGGSMGAGIALQAMATDVSLDIVGGWIADNATSGYGTFGAGLYAYEQSGNNATVTVESCEISGNYFAGGGTGAAMYFDPGVDATVSTSYFCDHDWGNEVSGSFTDSGDNTLANGWCVPGDVDEDLAVGTSDLLALLNLWNDSSVDEDDRADVNRDGDLDMLDLLELFHWWGNWG